MEQRPDPPLPTDGRPGAGIFSLEGRPAPGLYFVAWVLSLVGLALLLIGAMAPSPPASGLLSLVAIVVLGVGLASAAGYQVLARRARPSEAYRGPSPIVCFALVVVVSFVVLGPVAVTGFSLATGPGLLLVASVLAAGYLLTVLFFVVRTGSLSWREMIRPPSTPRTMGAMLTAVIGAAVLMIPVNLLLSVGGGLLALALDARPTSPLPPLGTSTDVAAVALAVVVVAPIAEEVFFRGFAISAWQRDLGARRALVRSAAFFGLIHLIDPGVQATSLREGLAIVFVLALVYLPLGLLLGWLYQRRGLLPAIAGHASFNATTLGLAALAARLAPT